MKLEIEVSLSEDGVRKLAGQRLELLAALELIDIAIKRHDERHHTNNGLVHIKTKERIPNPTTPADGPDGGPPPC